MSADFNLTISSGTRVHMRWVGKSHGWQFSTEEYHPKPGAWETMIRWLKRDHG